MSDREERIRRKAHEIWLAEGMPEGRDEEIWFKAQDFIGREDFEATVVVANAAPEAEDFEGLDRSDPAARQADTPLDPPTKPRKPRAPKAKAAKAGAGKAATAVSPERAASLASFSTGSR